MEQEKSLQVNNPSAIQTPQEGTPSATPNPTGHIPLLTPTPKKSFLKSPFFWIVIIVLFAFAGAYYFIYQGLENKVSQLTNKKTSQLNTTTQPVASWKEYKNIDYGFSIKYPLNWVVNDQISPNYITIHEAKAYKGNSHESHLDIELSRFLRTSQEYADDLEHRYKGSSFEFKQRKKIVLGDMTAEALQRPSSEGSYWIVILVNHQKLVTISVASLDESSLPKKMLDSIKLSGDTNIVKTENASIWKTYKNNVYNYSFQYPSNWNILEFGDNTITLQPAGFKGNKYSGAITFRSSGSNNFMTSFEDFLNKKASAEIQGLSTIKSLKKLINDPSTVGYDVEWNLAPGSPGPSSTFHLIYFKYPNRPDSRNIEIEDSGDSYRETVDKIIASFRFTKPDIILSDYGESSDELKRVYITSGGDLNDYSRTVSYVAYGNQLRLFSVKGTSGDNWDTPNENSFSMNNDYFYLVTHSGEDYHPHDIFIFRTDGKTFKNEQNFLQLSQLHFPDIANVEPKWDKTINNKLILSIYHPETETLTDKTLDLSNETITEK